MANIKSNRSTVFKTPLELVTFHDLSIKQLQGRLFLMKQQRNNDLTRIAFTLGRDAVKADQEAKADNTAADNYLQSLIKNDYPFNENLFMKGGDK